MGVCQHSRSSQEPVAAAMPGGRADTPCGGLLTDILTILILVLSAPLFLFGGFLMVFYYHVGSFDLASAWFSLLPKCYYASGLSNLVCAATVATNRVFLLGVIKRSLSIALVVVLASSCVVAAASTFGCFELQSVILQQTFLGLRTASITERYMTDSAFRVSWDRWGPPATSPASRGSSPAAAPTSSTPASRTGSRTSAGKTTRCLTPAARGGGGACPHGDGVDGVNGSTMVMV